MKNLDVDNMNNLDESFSNAGGVIAAFLKDPKNIRNTLLMGPAGAVVAAAKRAKEAKNALAEANNAEKEIARAELELAQSALAEANRQLEESKSSTPSSENSNGDSNSDNNASGERTGMNPAVKWSLIGGGILVVLVGGFFAIRYFKNK
jgi:hypothetical protein